MGTIGGFQRSIDPAVVDPADWAAQHFGKGHSADALARQVNRLASDWLEGALAELLAQGIGSDRASCITAPAVTPRQRLFLRCFFLKSFMPARTRLRALAGPASRFDLNLRSRSLLYVTKNSLISVIRCGRKSASVVAPS